MEEFHKNVQRLKNRDINSYKTLRDVEDANAEADSYILFHPWQFKSMYNKGTFSKKRNFLSKTKRKNKYQKVA